MIKKRKDSTGHIRLRIALIRRQVPRLNFFSFEQTKNPKPKPHLSLLANSIPPTTADNNLVKTLAEPHEPKKLQSTRRHSR
jgi:hypothetical protein